MDANEFKSVFMPYQPKLYRTAYAILRNAYEATENALQLFAEAFNKGDMQVEKARKATRNIKEKIDNIKNFRK